MLELCDELQAGRYELSSIANLAFKDASGAVRRNRLRPLMASEELDALPFADRTLFDPNKVCDPHRPIVMASRGCPYNCTYCCNQALREVVGKRPAVRIRSVARVLEELEQIRREVGGLNGFHFDDDIFGIKLGWLREFSAAYRARIGLPFGCNIRPPLAKPEVVQLLAEAGLRRSGNGSRNRQRRAAARLPGSGHEQPGAARRLRSLRGGGDRRPFVQHGGPAARADGARPGDGEAERAVEAPLADGSAPHHDLLPLRRHRFAR